MKTDRVYLEQLIDCARKIENFTKEMDYQAFSEDQKTQSAVIMQLTLIGELAKKVSSETRAQVDLPWKEITGFRDRAIHDYFQIDLTIVWETIIADIHELETAIITFLTP